MTDPAQPAATSVTYAATIYAYRVQVWAEQSADGGPIEEYTGGNSRHDSAAFVDAASPSALPLETMRCFAQQTAEELGSLHRVPQANIGYDTDLEGYLTEAYGPREAADA